MDIKDKVKKQFGENAQKYVTSESHAAGKDLLYLLENVQVNKNTILLDIATGGGHVANAFAPLVKEVYAADLTTEILDVAKKFITGNGHTNVNFIQADAESLPFEDAAFDLITCRIAAHHFTDVKRFLEEVVRVLKPGGTFAFIDNVAPETVESDSFYNFIEVKRDPSHVRAWKKSEWINMFETAGLTIEVMKVFKKIFDFKKWCDLQAFTGEAKDNLESYMLASSDDKKKQFNIQFGNGKVISFEGQSIFIKALKH